MARKHCRGKPQAALIAYQNRAAAKNLLALQGCLRIIRPPEIERA
jgi:hypothetical protein